MFFHVNFYVFLRESLLWCLNTRYERRGIRNYQEFDKFLMSLQERTKAQKTAYVKYWRLKEKLSIDKNRFPLFEGKKVLKKGEIKSA